jgi:hypothetical protein
MKRSIRLGFKLAFLVLCACWVTPLVAQEAPSATAPAATEVAPGPAAPQVEMVPTAAGQPTSAVSNLKKFDGRFSDLEKQIAKLKEDVFNSKTRVMQLREQVLQNVVAESRLVLVHENSIGMGFSLDRVIYYLDNNKIYFSENDNGQLDGKKAFIISDSTIVPGNHILTAEMTFKGSGGIFTYVSGYKFNVKSNYRFFATKGKIMAVRAIAFAKGGVAGKFEDKPGVKYEVKQVQYSKENLDSLLKEVQ